MTSLAVELASLLSSRSDALASACSARGVSSRVDALVMVFRDVIRDSSVCLVDGALSYFGGEAYLPVSEDDMLRTLRNVAVGMGVSPSDLRLVGRMPLDILAGDGKRRFSDRSLVAFDNGVLDLRSRRLMPFSPDLLVSARLPYPFDPSARPGLFLSFLGEVLPDPGRRAALQEFFGLCLADRSSLSVEKFAILIGEGANGKSVVCEVMSRAFGVSRVSFLDPAQLTDPKMLPELTGKWVNISNDTRRDAAFTSAVKALSSGQVVMARRNYHEPEQVVAPPLVFAMNAPPVIADRSRGFARRVLPIRFEVTIPESRQDRGLAHRICSSDLPGVFNWCLEGLDRLMANKGAFTSSPAMESDLDAIMGAAPETIDPVAAWLDERGLSVTPTKGGQEAVRVTAKEIYSSLGGRVSYNAIAEALRSRGAESRRSNLTYYLLYPREK